MPRLSLPSDDTARPGANRVPILSAGAGLGAFLIMLACVLTGAADGFDRAMLALLRGADGAGLGPGWVFAAARDLTAFGDSAVLTLLTILATAGFLVARRPGAGLTLALGMIGATLVSNGVKGWVGRARPDEALRLAEAHLTSFPSGHSLLSAAFFLILGGLLARAAGRNPLRGFILCVAAGMPLLVGVTRIYLGVHWASDVIAGWALGGAWAALCLMALRAAERGQAAR